MSCTESCSADSGARNPSTVSTWVALAAAGSAVGAAVVSAAERFRSTGTQAPARTRAAHHDCRFIGPLPPPPSLGSSLVLRLSQLLLASVHPLQGHVGRH